jgi:imidazolonepropionase-like amidohydrolase
MVEAGMPVLEAIQSATITSAKLLGIEDKLGSIKRGKLADIIAVKGDPREDVNLMTQVDFVMKEGKLYKQPEN